MKEAEHTSVDPASCFSLTKVWNVAVGGIKRFQYLFSTSKHCPRADNALVTEIYEEFQNVLCEYFLGSNISEPESTKTIQFQNLWYDMADEEHMWRVIMYLKTDDSNREGF